MGSAESPVAAVGDDKLFTEHNHAQDEESAAGAKHLSDADGEGYTIEQVERVYRKLDLRIIPGELPRTLN